MGDAGWTITGVIIGSLLVGLINYILQKNQFKHNKEMFLLQNQSSEFVKDWLISKLKHKVYIERSFDALKKSIGGYSDSEIRKLLHEIKAIKYIHKDNTEWWHLQERDKELIKIQKNTCEK